MKYPFEKHIVVCTGGRCNSPNLGEDCGEAIRARLKSLNKEMGNKHRIRVCAVSCLDLCDDGPNMIVWPAGRVHSHLDCDSAIEAYLVEAGRAD